MTFRPNPKPEPRPKKSKKPINKFSKKKLKSMEDKVEANYFAERMEENRLKYGHWKCENCGDRIYKYYRNWCHTLAKSSYPSLYLNPLNGFCLCYPKCVLLEEGKDKHTMKIWDLWVAKREMLLEIYRTTKK